MPVFGLHCSHEQVHPSALLAAVQQAEAAGFDAAMSSDHFSPWSARQGHSAFAWSWLGAALQATSLPFGVVNAPGQRYHPAIIAQAIATLTEMYPDRFWVALGSGEASNEHITGDRWPRKDVRNARLRECVDIIRALLAVRRSATTGWSPSTAPRSTAGRPPLPADRRRGQRSHGRVVRGVGRRADHRERAGRDAAPDGRRLPDAGGRGDLALQVHLSWAPDEREAEALAYDQWRSNVFPPPVCWDVDLAATFDAISEDVSLERVKQVVNVSADLGAHTAQLAEYAELGFDKIMLHHVGQEQEAFVDAVRREGPPPAA